MLEYSVTEEPEGKANPGSELEDSVHSYQIPVSEQEIKKKAESNGSNGAGVIGTIIHYTNPLHIYCRLRDLGAPKKPAIFFCSRYEKGLFKPTICIINAIKNRNNGGEQYIARKIPTLSSISATIFVSAISLSEYSHRFFK